MKIYFNGKPHFFSSGNTVKYLDKTVRFHKMKYPEIYYKNISAKLKKKISKTIYVMF